MSYYQTIDYLPPLQPSEQAAAVNLFLSNPAPDADGWQLAASASGYDQFALSHDTFSFNGVAGTKYELTTISYDHPGFPEIYDSAGKVIAVNSDASDGGTTVIHGVTYDTAVTTWVAPYTGQYYFQTSWEPTSVQTYYAMTLRENASQVWPTTFITSDKTSVNEGDSVLYTIKSTMLAPGTVLNWMLTGDVDASDFSSVFTSDNNSTPSGSDTSGTVTIDQQGGAWIDAFPSLDHKTEGPEHMTLIVGDAKGNVLATASVVTVNDTSLAWKQILGTDSSDTLQGTDGPDEIYALHGDDTLIGGAGNDLLHGGDGNDIAQYAGALANFTITKTTAGWTVTDNTGAEGSDQLDGIETLHFADADVALDLTGSAGQAYRIYQAAFDRAADPGGLGFWISYLDKGGSLDGMAAGFVDSDEFRSIYGSNPSGSDLLTRLYDNILHRAPDQAGFNYWLGILDNHQASVAQVLAAFSESTENQAVMIGVVGSGITYIPYH